MLIKNSNIAQSNMFPAFSDDNPCIKCIKRGLNLMAMREYFPSHIYADTLSYHADKAISPHSHA